MNLLIDIFKELRRTAHIGAQWLANLLKDHSDDPITPRQTPISEDERERE